MSVSRLSRSGVLRARGFATSSSLGALSAAARQQAERISSDWQGTSATGGTTKNFIGGEFVESKASEWIDVLDPVRSAYIQVPSQRLIFRAVDPNAALQGPTDHLHGVRPGSGRCITGVQDMESYECSWPSAVCHGVRTSLARLSPFLTMITQASTSATPERRRHSKQYRSGARQNTRRSRPKDSCFILPLTYLIDAHGDLLRGLQVVETAVGITSTLLGEKLEGTITTSSRPFHIQTFLPTQSARTWTPTYEKCPLVYALVSRRSTSLRRTLASLPPCIGTDISSG